MKILNADKYRDFLENFLNEPSFQKNLPAYDFTGKSILSLGCGFGRWERVIKDNFDVKKIVGIDQNDFIIQTARENNKDIVFRTMNYFELDESFLKEFDCIIWIPGPLFVEVLQFITNNYFFLRDNNVEILLWPGNKNFSTFYSTEFLHYIRDNNITDYNKDCYLHRLREIASFFTDEEYDSIIKMTTEELCKFKKCGRWSVLSGFYNLELERALKTQYDLLKLDKIKKSINKVKTQNFMFNGQFLKGDIDDIIYC